VRTWRNQANGSTREARQVSVRLYTTALALAPSTVSLNSQLFLPVAKILISRSRRLLSIGILPSSA
jgi:hypothetical protein